ncbi:MAG: hypothetical protein AAF685_14935 [Cyanobacteria bacterium P01_C01_bin.89]
MEQTGQGEGALEITPLKRAELRPEDLEPIADFDLNLPDPTDESLLQTEFNHRIDLAWKVCDRFDLQTDIWRGRILKVVRDREKQRGEGRGAGFLSWLKDHDISKSQAYVLIDLADSADTLMADDALTPATLRQFSKQAFLETAKAPEPVQQMIAASANQGDRITKQGVRQLHDEWSAATSTLLPEAIKERAAEHSLPAKYLAPLVRELEKLPEPHQVAIAAELEEEPELEIVKQATAQAKYLAKYLEAAIQVRTLDQRDLDLEQAMEEALRVGCLNVAADAINAAAQLEQALVKAYSTWRRLQDLSDRLYVDSGASTPNLRNLVSSLEGLTGNQLEIPLSDIENHSVQVQLQGEVPEELPKQGTPEQ